MTIEEATDWAVGVDIDIPTAARMCDYALGGSRNFAADREAVRRAKDAFSNIEMVARSNRGFLHRALRHLVAEAASLSSSTSDPGYPPHGRQRSRDQVQEPEAAGTVPPAPLRADAPEDVTLTTKPTLAR